MHRIKYSEHNTVTLCRSLITYVASQRGKAKELLNGFLHFSVLYYFLRIKFKYIYFLQKPLEKVCRICVNTQNKKGSVKG